MTANQIIAMCFPLLTAAVVGLTAPFIRKPWNEHKPQPHDTAAPEETLEQAMKLIRRAQLELRGPQPIQ
jgi:hypothetical protein